jgi:hypothetical protein
MIIALACSGRRHAHHVDQTCNAPEARAPRRLSLCVALGTIASVLGGTNAKAQEAEPRSYSNTPIGLNFLIAGYVYSEGKTAFDPDLASVE